VPNKVFKLTYLGVTDLAKASSAPPKTQLKTALERQRLDAAAGRFIQLDLVSLRLTLQV